MSGPAEPIRTDEITNVLQYLTSIDWTEPWLMGLIFFHFACLGFAILLRSHGNIQIGLFITLLMSVYFSENINEWAANNWRLFSREQYFDGNGFFISCVYSTPVLFNCLAVVLMWLYNAAGMMSEVRKKKLILKERRENKEKQKEGANSAEKTEDKKSK